MPEVVVVVYYKTCVVGWYGMSARIRSLGIFQGSPGDLRFNIGFIAPARKYGWTSIFDSIFDPIFDTIF